MIRTIGESVGETIAEGVGRVVGMAQEQRPLPADLLESDEAYLVVFDAPGAQPGDVQVRYEDGAVHARVDRFRAYHEGFDMVFPGRGLSLEGRKTLPPDAVVDPQAATATLQENGTLAVELPKIGSTATGEADETERTETVEEGDETAGEDEGEEATGGDEGEEATGEDESDESDADDADA